MLWERHTRNGSNCSNIKSLEVMFVEKSGSFPNLEHSLIVWLCQDVMLLPLLPI